MKLGSYVKGLCAKMVSSEQEDLRKQSQLQQNSGGSPSIDADKHVAEVMPREKETHDGVPTDDAPKSNALEKNESEDEKDDEKNDTGGGWVKKFEKKLYGLEWTNGMLAVRGMVAFAEIAGPRMQKKYYIEKLPFWTELGGKYGRVFEEAYRTMKLIRAGKPPLFDPEKSAPSTASAQQESAAGNKKDVPKNPIACAIVLPKNVICTPEPTSDMTESDLKQLVDIALERLDEISDIVYAKSSRTASADGDGGKKEGEGPARALKDFLQKHNIYEFTYHPLAKPGYLSVSFKMEFMPVQAKDPFSGLMRLLDHTCRHNCAIHSEDSLEEESEAGEGGADEAGTGKMVIENIEEPRPVPRSDQSSNATTDDKGAPIGTAGSDAGTK